LSRTIGGGRVPLTPTLSQGEREERGEQVAEGGSVVEPILISDLVRNVWRAVANRVRLLRRGGLQYVVVRVGGSLPEHTAPARRRFPLSLLPWPAPPLSVQACDEMLERLAADPRVLGVVLLVSGLSAGPAALAALRLAVGRARAAG
jgi:hypothetical protein